ncbi:MAG: hypothetical protein K8T91_15080 [Planctomycetes bacterium]|nr:hypothetical protein [Planctomycetota bacterium]
MPKYSPDIAGIMSCLCDALNDEVHGAEGCVIESSDIDNQNGDSHGSNHGNHGSKHDGDDDSNKEVHILIGVPDDRGGMKPYVIKIAPTISRKRVPLQKATLTVEVTYDSAVTDAESIANAADRLLETALSTPGILEEYGSPTFDSFYVASGPT